MIDRFEILYSRLRRTVSRTRWSARLAGHSPEPSSLHEPGLILIQIDGLGETALRRAIEQGKMPFLRRLVNVDGYQILSLYSGLPSGAAAFQAEFFYGAVTAFPASRYRDAARGGLVFLHEPETAAAVEQRLAAEHEGLLREGSAWSSVFSGGASESHLCASAVGFGGSLGGLRARQMVGLMVWQFWSAVRVVGHAAALVGLAFRDLVFGRIGLRELFHELREVPARTLLGAVMREMVATGATIDAERGLPVIQLGFVGYDEAARRRGPSSRVSLWTLRGIDRAIQRVWHAAHRSRRRDYAVWIYSDHGLERVTPYSRLSGVNLEETVERLCRQTAHRPLNVFPRPEPGPAGLGSRVRWLGPRLPRWLQPGDVRNNGTLAVSAAAAGTAGCVLVARHGASAHVYLPPGHDRACRADLANKLVKEGQVPLVLLAEEAHDVLALTALGRFRLPGDAPRILGADHPHLERAAQDLVRLVHHPEAGDLVLLGWDPKQPLSFEEQRGAAGGPGPAETSAFAVVPPEAQTFTPFPRDLRPSTLRGLALRTLRRQAPRLEIQEPEYLPPRITLADGTTSILVRLMTYNVHGCRGMDGVYSPGRIARVIARERPDVICLQELDQERTRSGGVDQVHRIAERLQLEYDFHAVSRMDDGRLGNAILSFLPMRRLAARPLPALPTAWNLWSRGALWVAVETEGYEVHVVNTHLSILDRERRVQARALTGPEWLGDARSRGAVILAGDMNAAPGSLSMRLLERVLRNAVPPEWEGPKLRTWSGRIPVRRIDHVFVSEAITVNNVYVPRTRLSRVASDHLPLVVDLVCRFPAQQFSAPEVLSSRSDGYMYS